MARDAIRELYQEVHNFSALLVYHDSYLNDSYLPLVTGTDFLGIKEDRIEVLHSLIRKGMITVSDVAQEMEISEEEFCKRYMEKVPEEKC